MKKIWVCGASGMLGSHFKQLLTERKMTFVANDYQEMDITQLEAVSDFVRTQNISHIINCAAYTQVDKAEQELKAAYLINAIGPSNLGIAGRRHGAHVIHFSTDYVFNGREKTPYIEEDVCSPIGAYGMSKFAGEMKLLDEQEDACIIRTSWLFGLSGKNFVETMLRLMSEKEELRVVADQIGRPTYCKDLAEVTLDLLDEEGVFHFANAFETTWYQFAQEIHRQAQELGFSLALKKLEAIETKDYPTLTQRPAYSTLSTNKIEQILGSSPRPWQEALKDYLVAYQHYQKMQPLSLSHV
jgi:dTDP-4-dehydrorhamnose reductase